MANNSSGKNSEATRVGQLIAGAKKRFASLRDELSRRIVESESRTCSAITALTRTVADLTDALRTGRVP